MHWRPRPTGTAVRLRAVSPAGHGVVWVVGDHGAVLRTDDGGTTWHRVDPPGAADLKFRAVRAHSARHAVVLSCGPGPAARVLCTEDGGTTWQSAWRNDSPDRFVDALAFATPTTGLLLADPVAGRFSLLSTSDGGRTWAPLAPQPLPDALPEALPGETAFAASGTCLFADGDHYCFVTGGAAARVFRSTDAGRTWAVTRTTLPARPDAGLFAVTFRDARHGMAVGGDYYRQDGAGVMAVTDDGGHTWHPTPTCPPGYRSAVAAAHCGYIVVGPAGTEASADDGDTWTHVPGPAFDAVRATADGGCWAAGPDGQVAVLATGKPCP